MYYVVLCRPVVWMRVLCAPKFDALMRGPLRPDAFRAAPVAPQPCQCAPWCAWLRDSPASSACCAGPCESSAASGSVRGAVRVRGICLSVSHRPPCIFPACSLSLCQLSPSSCLAFYMVLGDMSSALCSYGHPALEPGHHVPCLALVTRCARYSI